MDEHVVEQIPTKKAVELLKKDGIEVTEAEADEILTFLYLIADIAVDQFLSKKG